MSASTRTTSPKQKSSSARWSREVSEINNQDLNTLIQQGYGCHNQGDFSRAIAYFEEAAALARGHNKPDTELLALDCITVDWANIPDPQKALEIATHLLARARELHREDYLMRGGLRMVEAIANFDLRRRWPELKLLLHEGLQTARRLGNHWLEVYHLVKLAVYTTRVHKLEQGFAWTQEALNAISSGMEREHYLRGGAYETLSTIMRERENYLESVRFAEMALGEFSTHGNPEFIAEAQLELARAERERGQRGEALRLVEEIYQQSQQKGWKGHEQAAAYLRGELEREIGHPEAAEEFARHALQLTRELKKKEEEVESLLSLGKVLKALGRKEDARTPWQEARQLSREREYEDHFNEAEEMLSMLEQGGQ